MTTKVILLCPDTSHWAVKASVQDRVFSFDAQKYTDEWREADSFILNPAEQRETYVHSSRRIMIMEVER